MKKDLLNAGQLEEAVSDNPLFHDTWKLLRKYRDVVFSLELSIQHVKKSFEIEFGSTVDEFLDSLYVAGLEFEGTRLEQQAKNIERSNKMVKMLESAVELLRSKHKFGDAFYWVLYYTYLSPQELKSIPEIIETLRPHISYISYRTYYRHRREAVEALSSILWGYTSKDCIELLERLFPDEDNGT
jgi:hypothetical protein